MSSKCSSVAAWLHLSMFFLCLSLKHWLKNHWKLTSISNEQDFTKQVSGQRTNKPYFSLHPSCFGSHWRLPNRLESCVKFVTSELLTVPTSTYYMLCMLNDFTERNWNVLKHCCLLCSTILSTCSWEKNKKWLCFAITIFGFGKYEHFRSWIKVVTITYSAHLFQHMFDTKI